MSSKPLILPPGVAGHRRCHLTSHYSILPPEGVLESRIPGIEKTVIRILAAPSIGANFVQMLWEIKPGGRSSDLGEPGIEAFAYVLSGEVSVVTDVGQSILRAGDYAYIAPGASFSFENATDGEARVVWLRKRYQILSDVALPASFFGATSSVERVNKHTSGRFWQHLLPDHDTSFDMAMNILSFAPGTYFPMIETHIMQHGLYMLQGQGMYQLGNEDWHECWTGDFIWMGPFCPQFFIATGWEEAQYLLFKDVNRNPEL